MATYARNLTIITSETRVSNMQTYACLLSYNPMQFAPIGLANILARNRPSGTQIVTKNHACLGFSPTQGVLRSIQLDVTRHDGTRQVWPSSVKIDVSC